MIDWLSAYDPIIHFVCILYTILSDFSFLYARVVQYVVHGSGGNLSQKPRRTYVIAFRTADTVARERAAGFSHSHNDEVNWDQFNKWTSTLSTAPATADTGAGDTAHTFATSEL
jgi:hypothetical protein